MVDLCHQIEIWEAPYSQDFLNGKVCPNDERTTAWTWECQNARSRYLFFDETRCPDCGADLVPFTVTTSDRLISANEGDGLLTRTAEASGTAVFGLNYRYLRSAKYWAYTWQRLDRPLGMDTLPGFQIPSGEAQGPRMHFQVQVSESLDFTDLVLDSSSIRDPQGFECLWPAENSEAPNYWKQISDTGLASGYLPASGRFTLPSPLLTPGQGYYVRYRALDTEYDNSFALLDWTTPENFVADHLVDPSGLGPSWHGFGVPPSGVLTGDPGETPGASGFWTGYGNLVFDLNGTGGYYYLQVRSVYDQCCHDFQGCCAKGYFPERWPDDRPPNASGVYYDDRRDVLDPADVASAEDKALGAVYQGGKWLLYYDASVSGCVESIPSDYAPEAFPSGDYMDMILRPPCANQECPDYSGHPSATDTYCINYDPDETRYNVFDLGVGMPKESVMTCPNTEVVLDVTALMALRSTATSPMDSYYDELIRRYFHRQSEIGRPYCSIHARNQPLASQLQVCTRNDYVEVLQYSGGPSYDPKRYRYRCDYFDTLAHDNVVGTGVFTLDTNADPSGTLAKTAVPYVWNTASGSVPATCPGRLFDPETQAWSEEVCGYPLRGVVSRSQQCPECSAQASGMRVVTLEPFMSQERPITAMICVNTDKIAAQVPTCGLSASGQVFAVSETQCPECGTTLVCPEPAPILSRLSDTTSLDLSTDDMSLLKFRKTYYWGHRAWDRDTGAPAASGLSLSGELDHGLWTVVGQITNSYTDATTSGNWRAEYAQMSGARLTASGDRVTASGISALWQNRLFQRLRTYGAPEAKGFSFDGQQESLPSTSFQEFRANGDIEANVLFDGCRCFRLRPGDPENDENSSGQRTFMQEWWHTSEDFRYSAEVYISGSCPSGFVFGLNFTSLETETLNSWIDANWSLNNDYWQRDHSTTSGTTRIGFGTWSPFDKFWAHGILDGTVESYGSFDGSASGAWISFSIERNEGAINLYCTNPNSGSGLQSISLSGAYDGVPMAMTMVCYSPSGVAASGLPDVYVKNISRQYRAATSGLGGELLSTSLWLGRGNSVQERQICVEQATDVWGRLGFEVQIDAKPTRGRPGFQSLNGIPLRHYRTDGWQCQNIKPNHYTAGSTPSGVTYFICPNYGRRYTDAEAQALDYRCPVCSGLKADQRSVPETMVESWIGGRSSSAVLESQAPEDRSCFHLTSDLYPGQCSGDLMVQDYDRDGVPDFLAHPKQFITDGFFPLVSGHLLKNSAWTQVSCTEDYGPYGAPEDYVSAQYAEIIGDPYVEILDPRRRNVLDLRLYVESKGGNEDRYGPYYGHYQAEARQSIDTSAWTTDDWRCWDDFRTEVFLPQEDCFPATYYEYRGIPTSSYQGTERSVKIRINLFTASDAMPVAGIDYILFSSQGWHEHRSQGSDPYDLEIYRQSNNVWRKTVSLWQGIRPGNWVPVNLRVNTDLDEVLSAAGIGRGDVVELRIRLLADIMRRQQGTGAQDPGNRVRAYFHYCVLGWRQQIVSGARCYPSDAMNGWYQWRQRPIQWRLNNDWAAARQQALVSWDTDWHYNPAAGIDTEAPYDLRQWTARKYYIKAGDWSQPKEFYYDNSIIGIETGDQGEIVEHS